MVRKPNDLSEPIIIRKPDYASEPEDWRRTPSCHKRARIKKSHHFLQAGQCMIGTHTLEADHIIIGAHDTWVSRHLKGLQKNQASQRTYEKPIKSKRTTMYN